MEHATISQLFDRGVVSVTGDDARTFLDNLITNDMALLDTHGAIFAGLLSPQGKILFEFFVVRAGEGYLLDVAVDQAAGLVKRLSMYKLRAKVDVAVAPDYKVLAGGSGLGVPDPRSPALGLRILSASAPEVTGTAEDYHARRIALGIPEGGKDYAFGDTFPHDALFDHLNGVSFNKGCYVGQEIVARMEHRGTARKRIVRITGTAPLPPAGTDVRAGEAAIGTIGSSSAGRGLAMLRVDRVAEFVAKGVPLTADGATIAPEMDDVARLMPRSPDPLAVG
jgi:tRNA-modifying protein YgfZ